MKRTLALVVAAFALLCINTAAFAHDDHTTLTVADSAAAAPAAAPVSQGTTVLPVDPSLFLADSLIASITEEACTLSGGTETTCYRITVSSIPTDHEAGPWCPRTITDSANVAGIWFESGVVYDLTGEFIRNLATFYNDAEWMLYNADGSINVTDTVEAFQAAARPNVDPAYQNYCVEGQLEWLSEDATLSTYIIPVTPVLLASTQAISNSALGVAFNGVNFDPPAPVQAILAAHTIAAIDDCGGHINNATGYHYHAHTGCTPEVEQADGHAPLIGYAMDGIGMYAHDDEAGNDATDLDTCGGHYDDVRGYHYHVGDAGSNMTLGCFSAEVGCVFADLGTGQTCDATATATQGPGAGGPGGGAGGPDLAAAAAQLGITEAALQAALGDQRPPDFAAAAATLGITAEALQQALGTP